MRFGNSFPLGDLPLFLNSGFSSSDVLNSFVCSPFSSLPSANMHSIKIEDALNPFICEEVLRS